MSLTLLAITGFLSYISATFMIESISYLCAVKSRVREDSLFPDENYQDPKYLETINKADGKHKKSPYYIRKKLELGLMTGELAGEGFKIAVMVMMVIYMYGAMCLKYVSGAESFVDAVSFAIYGDGCQWTRISPIDPYYIGLFVFGFLSLIFCFGNIENSKMLQIVTSFLRFIVVTMMYIGTFYYIGVSGTHPTKLWNFSE
jgi:hypothetical protein